jgi:hypothetical protein
MTIRLVSELLFKGLPGHGCVMSWFDEGVEFFSAYEAEFDGGLRRLMWE